jgi:hypothetical protein
MGGGTYQPQNPFASMAGGAMLGGSFGSSIYDWFKGGQSSQGPSNSYAPNWNMGSGGPSSSGNNPFDAYG